MDYGLITRLGIAARCPLMAGYAFWRFDGEAGNPAKLVWVSNPMIAAEDRAYSCHDSSYGTVRRWSVPLACRHGGTTAQARGYEAGATGVHGRRRIPGAGRGGHGGAGARLRRRARRPGRDGTGPGPAGV